MSNRAFKATSRARNLTVQVDGGSRLELGVCAVEPLATNKAPVRNVIGRAYANCDRRAHRKQAQRRPPILPAAHTPSALILGPIVSVHLLSPIDCQYPLAPILVHVVKLVEITSQRPQALQPLH